MFKFGQDKRWDTDEGDKILIGFSLTTKASPWRYLQHVVPVIDAQLTQKLRLLASMRNWSSDDSMQWPMNKRLLRDRADSLILRNIAL